MSYRDHERQKEAQRQHYRDNKDEYRDRDKRTRKQRKQWFFDEVLSKVKCGICGENHPAVLDFHHRDPNEKEGSISAMVNGFRPKALIMKEIKKCDVLCSNCHRKHHWDKRYSRD